MNMIEEESSRIWHIMAALLIFALIIFVIIYLTGAFNELPSMPFALIKKPFVG